MTSRHDDPTPPARELGSRRLSALTVGVTAASLLGVGLVAGYDAHLFQQSTNAIGTGTGSGTGTPTQSGSTTNVRGHDDGSRDDGATGGTAQLQAPANPPAGTQQQPHAVTGGS